MQPEAMITTLKSLKLFGMAQAVGRLAVVDVVRDLGVELLDVVVIHDPRARQVSLLEPPQLLAVRAVRENALHVAQDGGVDEPVNAVEEVAGAGEFAGHRRGGMDEQAFQGGDARLAGDFHLDVAEAVVAESRAPRFGLAAGQRVGIPVRAAG